MASELLSLPCISLVMQVLKPGSYTWQCRRSILPHHLVFLNGGVYELLELTAQLLKDLGMYNMGNLQLSPLTSDSLACTTCEIILSIYGLYSLVNLQSRNTVLDSPS